MIYIPDPLEILERQQEAQMDLIDKDGTYPCSGCGQRHPVDLMFSVSDHPASPLMCTHCTRALEGSAERGSYD